LLHEVTPYDEQVRNIIDKNFNQLASGKTTDVNTALRKAKDEMNQKVDELAGSNKEIRFRARELIDTRRMTNVRHV
jgi:hypothetical protein